MFKKKLKAGALQLTLFIVIAIALLLTAFVMLVNSQQRFKLQTQLLVETVETANKGIDYALDHNIRLQDSITLAIEDRVEAELKIYKSAWGIFEKVIVNSSLKKNTIQKAALIGASQQSTNRMALYLEENNKPLVVVGKTKIQGLAFIPKQGVRPGHIAGDSYYGAELIYGRTRTSSALPEMQVETLQYLKREHQQLENQGQTEFIDISRKRKHRNSFYKPVQLLYSNGDIRLSDLSLTGHIIVKSKTKIIVEASAILKDVLLIAPYIEIRDHAKGTFQAIATENIVVGGEVRLEYPSALVLDPTKKLEASNPGVHKKQHILIGKSSEIHGVVAYIGEKKLMNYSAQINIEPTSKIIGEVYCTQNTELQGSVIGRVFTGNFVANQKGSVYQNHIYNGRINIDGLQEEYVGLLIKNTKKGVAKWLY